VLNTDPLSQLRILIVDDSPQQADAIATLLLLRGYSVQVAYSATAALEQVVVYKADVALIDVGLPDIDGFQLVPRLRDHIPSAVFIVVSGYAGEAYREKARSVGVEHYFIKPVAVSKLRRVLDKVISPQSLHRMA